VAFKNKACSHDLEWASKVTAHFVLRVAKMPAKPARLRQTLSHLLRSVDEKYGSPE